MKLSDAPYKGWTNYETFSVCSAFKNDTKLHKELKKATPAILSCGCPEKRKKTLLIEVLHDIFLQENKVTASPYFQLINHAAEGINWNEIAERLKIL